MANLTIDVLDAEGNAAGTALLPEELFAVQTNVPLIHQVVVAQLAAARQGTHDTKTRGEVRGGGKKPYKQKGTGRARQGSTRAPQFTGGGTVHGPTPRDYTQRTPKKMKAAALRGALSDRARHGRVHVVESLVAGDAPGTKAAAVALAKVSDRRNLLVVVERDDVVTWKSIRNLTRVHAARTRPAEHVRRAVRGRRGLHPGRARRLRRGPGPRQGRDGDRDQQRGGGPVSQIGKINRDPRDILLAPVVSEKSYGLLDQGKYTFVVAPGANKTEIRQAVEKVFGVTVASVNTINRQGKSRRTRMGLGKRKDTKRAIVTLKDGTIDIFGGPVA